VTGKRVAFGKPLTAPGSALADRPRRDNPGGSMPCLKLTLTIIGVALEVVGFALTAWPELTAPTAKRLSAAVRRRTATLERFARRLLRRQRHYTMAASAGRFTIKGRTAGGIVSPPADADSDRLLVFLRDQAMETQKRLNELERHVADHPGQWKDELQSVRTALEVRIAEDLERERDLFIGRRLVGLGCIALGSVVLAVVNLLPE
jgi:hypothetical protein